jgi:predicted  nucleic acid-binding Zn-ribbon protein
MGPTNVSLVNLFRADQDLRAARERLDAAAKNVRVQERRVNDLTAKLKASQHHLKELQSKAGTLDLDLRSRDAHIEKLRTQQQSAKNNKEYQAFLIEINTAKVDKAKVEEETMRAMESVEKGIEESASFTTQLEAERVKLTEFAAQIDDTLKQLQVEVDALKPAREAAAAQLPAKVIAEFDRLAERFDGEALAALAKPDRRREEYLCTACNMDLVADIYNKLHSRDELVPCPSCRRLLYIPEDLPPETAIKKPVAATRIKVRTGSRSSKTSQASTDDGSPVVIEQRAKGRLGEVLAQAQGESVSRAAAADHKPFDFEVSVDGEVAGVYKGNSAENLERAIKYFMGEAGLTGEVHVSPLVAASDAAEPASEAATPVEEEQPQPSNADASSPA